MEIYRPYLKQPSRQLRNNMTEAEEKLWFYLRRKQIQGLQFYRQKPLFDFIVDFYCPSAKLVIELDGSQHYEIEHQLKDQARDELLNNQGLLVLRFDNRQVLLEIDSMLAVIHSTVKQQLIIKP